LCVTNYTPTTLRIKNWWEITCGGRRTKNAEYRWSAQWTRFSYNEPWRAYSPAGTCDRSLSNEGKCDVYIHFHTFLLAVHLSSHIWLVNPSVLELLSSSLSWLRANDCDVLEALARLGRVWLQRNKWRTQHSNKHVWWKWYRAKLVSGRKPVHRIGVLFEECRLLGFGAVWLLCEPTFLRNKNHTA
jgi:hypothetical protein